MKVKGKRAMTEYGIITYTRLAKEVREKLDMWARQEQRSTAAQIAMIVETALREREEKTRAQDAQKELAKAV